MSSVTATSPPNGSRACAQHRGKLHVAKRVCAGERCVRARVHARHTARTLMKRGSFVAHGPPL